MTHKQRQPMKRAPVQSIGIHSFDSKSSNHVSVTIIDVWLLQILIKKGEQTLPSFIHRGLVVFSLPKLAAAVNSLQRKTRRKYESSESDCMLQQMHRTLALDIPQE